MSRAPTLGSWEHPICCCRHDALALRPKTQPLEMDKGWSTGRFRCPGWRGAGPRGVGGARGPGVRRCWALRCLSPCGPPAGHCCSEEARSGVGGRHRAQSQRSPAGQGAQDSTERGASTPTLRRPCLLTMALGKSLHALTYPAKRLDRGQLGAAHSTLGSMRTWAQGEWQAGVEAGGSDPSLRPGREERTSLLGGHGGLPKCLSADTLLPGGPSYKNTVSWEQPRGF